MKKGGSQRNHPYLNKIMIIELTIAGVNICVQSNFDIKIGGESEPFLNDFEKSDCFLEYFESSKNSFSDKEDGIQNGNRIFCRSGKEQTVYLVAHPGEEPYGKVTYTEGESYRIKCEYLKNNEFYINYLKNIYTAFGLESILLHFDAIILHSSFIKWKNMGILFSAPSGTGKSTQASLWGRYENAEIINGDRAAIRKYEDVWKAYGLPIAGSSGIYRNDSADLKCIVLLEQAEVNNIKKVSPAEAFRFIYPEAMIHRWDRLFEETASNLLLSIVTELPVYKLKCTPDRDAVNELKKHLEVI